MPFKPGQSGNPGGRPKEDPEVKELARQHTAEAIERLAAWMRSDNPKASVSAAVQLLDRGWGRASQSIEHSGKDGEDVAFTDTRALARAILGILSEAEFKDPSHDKPPIVHHKH